jgi:4-carboxymuconolactone decarboxylase
MKPILISACLLLISSTADAEERFAPLAPEAMSPEQKAVADAIVATRGSMAGPFDAWLRDPALADRLQKLGEQIRFHSSLPRALNEFAILITARHWTSQFEWYAHYPLAMKAGLEPAVAADLAAGDRPRGMTDDEAAIYDFSLSLHATGNVEDAVYGRVRDRFGEQGVIDLIAVNGYYDLVSMTLNVARVGVPAGTPQPLKSLQED